MNNKTYVDLYRQYMDEINNINKSIRVFNLKKNRILNKGIYATDAEVNELERALLGDAAVEIVETKTEADNTEVVDVEDLDKLIDEDDDSFILNELDRLEDMEASEGAKKSADAADKKSNVKVSEGLDIDTFFGENAATPDSGDDSDDGLNSQDDASSEKIYQFSNGDRFIGRVVDLNMEGTGSYMFAPSDSYSVGRDMEYIGEFRQSVREGGGTFIYPNGNEYTGYFVKNISNGIGRMKYKNGDEYLGNWKDGKKEGMGIYTWHDGYTYIGSFSNSKMEGEGSCYNEKGELVYEGDWKNNLIDGKGKYIWKRGKYYEGEFSNGKKHGYGCFYLDNELVYDGTWKEDKPSIFDKSIDEILAKLISK